MSGQAAYRPAAAPEPASATRSWSTYEARVSNYSPPRVAILADTARISGRLYNSGDVLAEGYARVELYRGEDLFKTERVFVTIPPRSAANWQTDIFVGTNASTWGALSARVFWE